MDEISATSDRRVFISYANDDVGVARALQHRLQEEGLEVWSPDSISPGERWGAAIQRALTTADDVVVLLSEAASTSPGVSVEVGAAVAAAESGEGRRIIPVLLDDSVPGGLLASYQWLRGAGKPPLEIANEVVRVLKAPIHAESNVAARANELRELHTLGAALSALREREAQVEMGRTRLVAVSLIVALCLATGATAIALLSGAEVAGATLATILSASVGLLGVVAGFFVGRQSDGRSNE